MISTVKGAAAKLSTTAMLTLAGAQHALAAEIPPLPNTGGGSDNITDVFQIIIDVILNVLGGVAVLVIVIAGLRLIIGGSDESQREKARSAILYAVIGLVIVLFAKALVTFVFENL